MRLCAPLSRVLKGWGSFRTSVWLSPSLKAGLPFQGNGRDTVFTGTVDMAWLVLTPTEVYQRVWLSNPLETHKPKDRGFGVRNSWVQILTQPLRRKGTSLNLSVPV